MADNKGTDNPLEGCSSWYIVSEAECEDLDDSLERLFDNVSENEGSDICDLVDNATVEQGNSLELFQAQQAAEDCLLVDDLKRKYNRQVADLSPRLEKILISPRKPKKLKKALFLEDSGIVSQNETTSTFEELQVENNTGDDFVAPAAAGNGAWREPSQVSDSSESATTPESSQNSQEKVLAPGLHGEAAVKVLMKTTNYRGLILGKFKDMYGVSFGELCRTYKSDKTMSTEWAMLVYGLEEAKCNVLRDAVESQCNFIFVYELSCICLCLFSFKSQKCRDTVLKLVKTFVKLNDLQIVLEPPKTQSTAVALYFYSKCVKEPGSYKGQFPEWIEKQTSYNHKFSQERMFELSPMVQWAYDNEVYEECDIAFGYAQMADGDENARAFLRSNSQAKIVKDVSTMVRHYKRAEMKRMSMAEWVHRRCREVKDPDEQGWKQIAMFLRYQGIEWIAFVAFMRKFMKGEPKKSCIVLWGPPNTGKSLFGLSLIQFLKGKILSFCNSNSQFWLQPLRDAKIAMIDDMTMQGWKYVDVYLRGGLDGNLVCIDAKHKAPAQLKFPPILITTNVDVLGENSLIYLHSRIKCFKFPETLPICATGEPKYLLNDTSWQSFFKRFWTYLEFSDQEEEDESEQPLRLDTRSDPKPL
ncbi:E1 [Eptesicus regulus papillomavirus]|nr:E1 [Eptesicus regulus papillomavirus]